MFLKIFLSFWLTVCLFVAAQEMAARLAHDEEQRTIGAVRTTIDAGRAIVAAYEKHGANGAREAADAFEQRHGLFADLLDAKRVSITGRPVRPAEIQLARLADRFAAAGMSESAFSGGEALAAQQVVTAAGERLTMVVGLPRSVTTVVSRALLVSWPVRLLVVLTIGGLACFIVARRLARPIVEVTGAANALAEGRLQARVAPGAAKRRDELGALARDFNRMAERIEALVAGQRRLLGDVSHELRSPLARLTVALGLARQGGTGDATEYFARIEREAGRLDRMIEQLLTLARIENGVEAKLRGPFDLAEVVQEVVSDGDFEARASDRQVTLTGCQPAISAGTADLVRSAIENVIRNAIRHTPPGTSVDVALEVTADRARVSVRDRGRGVDETMTADIFKPFWRAPSSENGPPEGAGLGLAIVDRIVRMHDGRVSAANAPDGGLVVTIDLPLAGADRESGTYCRA